MEQDDYEDNDGGWTLCSTCGHMAQSHDLTTTPPSVICAGDKEGDVCDCMDYKGEQK